MALTRIPVPASHRFRSMFVVACVMLAPQPHTNPLANGLNCRNRSLTAAARFRPPAGISACYAPGTPQSYVEQFERLIHPPPDPNAYNGSNRWTQTASDGSVFSNGQPITDLFVSAGQRYRRPEHFEPDSRDVRCAVRFARRLEGPVRRHHGGLVDGNGNHVRRSRR